MAKKVSFSGQNLSLAEAALHHDDVESSLRLYFSNASPSYTVRFTGYRTDEVTVELRDRLVELDRNSTMSLLSAVEAAFRIDHPQRCYRRGKDDVSRRFREIYGERGTRARLDDDIFEVWKNNAAGASEIIGELRGAFKFRHWMAHGRYWVPKHGGRYDHLTVYALCARALSAFPLLTP